MLNGGREAGPWGLHMGTAQSTADEPRGNAALRKGPAAGSGEEGQVPPGRGPRQGTVASAVVHTPVVILAHSHTWEMGFDTVCPFRSCALPGELAGVWGEAGGFSRRATPEPRDGSGRSRIRALGTSPR